MGLKTLLSRPDLPSDVVVELTRVLHEMERDDRDRSLLHTVLESMSSAVAVADVNGRLVLFNRAARDLLGLDPTGGDPDTWSTIYGLFLQDGVTPFPVDDYPLILACRGESTDEVEMFVRNDMYPNGRSIQVSGRPWRDAQGKLLGGVAVFSDVTQLRFAWLSLQEAKKKLARRVEERTRELQSTQLQLVQAQKLEALGRLSGGVAHDFNNLLTAIMGYTEILLGDEELRSDHRESIREIHRAGERAAELTSHLLAFSRRQPVERRPVDVNGLIRDLERLLGRLLGASISIRVALDTDIPPAFADPGRIEQVLLNLAVNARDAMPDGGTLNIETSLVQLPEGSGRRLLRAQPGRYVRIVVRDAGVGMNADTQRQVFEPFFTTKAPDVGTGLGLSTVYGIVQQHDGDIRVDSKPGRGTTFEIDLPVADTGHAVVAPAEAVVAAPRARPGETILVAEDEEGVRNLVRQTLESYGYVVLTAADGESAVRLGQTHSGEIDLLLTDSVMPHSSGHSLAAKLHDSRAAMRVLYMSGFPDNAANGPFLAKPFTPLALARKVREVIDSPADGGSIVAALATDS